MAVAASSRWSWRGPSRRCSNSPSERAPGRPNGMIQARNGLFYGTTGAHSLPRRTGKIFAMDATGASTTVHGFGRPRPFPRWLTELATVRRRRRKPVRNHIQRLRICLSARTGLQSRPRRGFHDRDHGLRACKRESFKRVTAGCTTTSIGERRARRILREYLQSRSQMTGAPSSPFRRHREARTLSQSSSRLTTAVVRHNEYG